VASLTEQLRAIALSVEKRFAAHRRILSIQEYFEVFAQDPVRQSRDASRYLKSAFDHYGSTHIKVPWGEFTRWNLFDLPWISGGHKQPLIGQEHVQEEIYRALSNFAREGRPSRLVLLHGPNGSAKTTIVSCMMQALEQYSTLEEGALYRFHWVFPSQKTIRGSVGFGGQKESGPPAASYAHLPDDQIDAKLLVEVRDHPLFLLPTEERKQLLERAWPKDAEAPSDWILRGQLSHKSQQVLEALLSSYTGSFSEVLKHVQVERYFISQRYRVGAVTVGPQMSVDAGERQLTADRSLGALPPSLQAVPLYEAKGELIDAGGGLLEFSDLLKRPLDAFKYLQLSIETGEVARTQQNIQLNCVMVGSANEVHLDAFREHPEFASFRGRLELVRVPYLRSYVEEQRIYDELVLPSVARHVAPHTTNMAAMFAVLTRMRKPSPDRYGRAIGAIVSTLTALEKMDLYALGAVPERLDPDAQKLLHANVRALFDESESYPIYEGRVGASPREMRVVLLDAAQSTTYRCLSPLATLDEIEALCQRRSEFEWLQQEPVGGGYHDVKQFLETLLARLLDSFEEELYNSSGLVEEARYGELFERYVQHVSVWVKKERILNRVTGQYEEPDEKLMQEVERLLDVKGDAGEARKQMISTIAAWSLDHSGEKVEATRVFPYYLRRIREAMYAERRGAVAKLARDLVLLVRENGEGLDDEHRRAARACADRMQKFGYCDHCAADAASVTWRRRFGELVV